MDAGWADAVAFGAFIGDVDPAEGVLELGHQAVRRHSLADAKKCNASAAKLVGFLTSTRYISCTIRPSGRMKPRSAKKSWIGMSRPVSKHIDRNMCNSESDVHVRPAITPMRWQETAEMGIRSFIRLLFGADTAAPPDATKLDGTTEATLARSLSVLPPDERGWVTLAEASILFSTKGAQYAFGETDHEGRRNIESFAAQHRSVINFMPVEGRVYFVRDPTAVTSIT